MLWQAASEGHLDAVIFLLENGSDGNMRDRFENTALNDAVRHKHDDVSRYIRQHFLNSKVRGGVLILPGCQAAVAFLTAAHKGDFEGVQRFVENGVAVNGPDYDGYCIKRINMCLHAHHMH